MWKLHYACFNCFLFAHVKTNLELKTLKKLSFAKGYHEVAVLLRKSMFWATSCLSRKSARKYAEPAGFSHVFIFSKRAAAVTT